MEESILNSVKNQLSIAPDDTAFDAEIMIHINSVLATLNQLGIGPADGFGITGADDKWADFIGSNKKLNMARSYVGIKVRILFDPPSNSFTLEAFKQAAAEWEWRLNVQREEELLNG